MMASNDNAKSKGIEPDTNEQSTPPKTLNKKFATPDLAEKSTKRDASWPSVLFYIHLNILGLYGVLVLFKQTSLTTTLFTSLLTLIGILGSTTGAHRLWAHQTYKANNFLKVMLMLAQTMAGQGSIYNWVQKHRLHHETFKTADDIYYSEKNLLHAQVFAQIRSLSPKQEEMLKRVDMKDLEEDKIVMFQKKFYWILYLVFFVLLPINAPLEYWGDTVQAALFVTFSLRYLIVLNVSWLINSAHFVWGLDKSSKPSDSNMIFIVTKSYWPQYHYLLPWDYQCGEFGSYGTGCSTSFIRVYAALGLATDLQTVTTDAVKTGLMMAVDSNRPVVDCLREASALDMKKLPKDHYLKREKFN